MHPGPYLPLAEVCVHGVRRVPALKLAKWTFTGVKEM